MNTVVCPQCGSSNPDKNEFCQWCHAPLHPEAASGFEGSESASIDLPDWLKEAGPFPPSPTESSDEELPDWLLSLRQASETSDFGEEIQPTSGEESFLTPDLEKILPADKDEETETLTQPEPLAQEDLTEWISRLQGEEATEEAPFAAESIPVTGQSEEELPEWLKALREQEEPPVPETYVVESEATFSLPEPEPFVAESLPEWLKDSSALSEEGKQAETLPTEEIAQGPEVEEAGLITHEAIPPFTEIPEDITAWFEETPASIFENRSSGVYESTPTPEEFTPTTELPPTDEIPEESPEVIPAFSEEDYAAWLDHLKIEETLEEGNLAAQIPAFVDNGIAETAPSPETIVPPFIESELPEWLAEAESPAEGAESGVTPAAQLPEWLEAMRPVEAVAPTPPHAEEEDTRIETSGPLAGFQGVLPGEPEALRYSRPPIHAVRLNVSEKQRAYAALLETLVTAESTPTPLRVQKQVTAPSPILRLAITIVLFAILITGWASATPPSALPTLFPAEAVAFATTINNLSAQHPAPRVLVGLDIDAGFLPEIRTATINTLSDLMRQDARLVFLPLQSNAPVLGLAMAQEAAQQIPGYALSEQSVHLGYLAGETTGLAAFAYQPRLGMVTTLEGQPAWDTQPLIGVNSLQDFDAILLITDSGERARGWIEQLRPLFSERPFLVISSAQAAPYLAPYVQSEQINGMLTGLLGSILYTRLTPKVGGENLALWSAYQWGSLTIALLILLGALAGATQALSQAQKSRSKR